MIVNFKYNMYGLMCHCTARLEYDDDSLYMEELEMWHKSSLVDTNHFCEDVLWYDIEKVAIDEAENEYIASQEALEDMLCDERKFNLRRYLEGDHER